MDDLPDYSEIDAALKHAAKNPQGWSLLPTCDLDFLVECARSAPRVIAQVRENLNLAQVNSLILDRLIAIEKKLDDLRFPAEPTMAITLDEYLKSIGSKRVDLNAEEKCES